MATIDVNKPISFESSSQDVQSWINRINEEVTNFKAHIQRVERMANSSSSFAGKAQDSLDLLKGGLDTFTAQAKKATEQIEAREEAAFNNDNKHITLIAERIAGYIQTFNKDFGIE